MGMCAIKRLYCPIASQLTFKKYNVYAIFYTKERCQKYSKAKFNLTTSQKKTAVAVIFRKSFHNTSNKQSILVSSVNVAVHYLKMNGVGVLIKTHLQLLKIEVYS